MAISAGLTCDLCDLPISGNGYQRSYSGVDRRFCCAGCLNVYAILAESGTLQSKERAAAFRVGSELGLFSQDSDAPDNPAPWGAAAESSDGESFDRDIEIPIRGMWCSSCAWLIERVLLKRDGVLACRASFVNDSARVRYSPRFISRQEILDQIRELGYDPEIGRTKAADAVQRDLLIRLAVACAPGMYMMMFNFVLYGGYFGKLDPGVLHFMQQLLLFLSLPIVTYCAWPIYRKAWGALRHGTTTMETLITLGAGSAFLFSLYATLRGHSQVYYDTASMIITLVLLGKYLEAVARARAVAAVGALGSVLPRKVRLRLASGEDRLVAADQVRAGDHVVVDAGATVPVDGMIVDGTAALDESLLTGESIPVRRGPGEPAVGASLCVEGGIVVQASRTGSETTVSRMASVVRDAMAARSGSERLADRVSRIFVPLIIAAAGLVLCRDVFVAHRSMEYALMQAVSMLVVACPCALGMATPLAIAAAMGSAARRGILIRNGQVLENATRVDTVILDKTGTLTHGRLHVVEVLTEPGFEADHSYLDAFASLESLSQHPAARAITGWAMSQGASVRRDVEMEIIPGRGIRGRVGSRYLYIGAVEGLAPFAVSVAERIEAAEAAGNTVVAAFSEDRPLCAFILADVPRPGAAEAVRQLRGAGIDVWLVSGDSAATTAFVGGKLGIDQIISRALPEDKIARVKELRASGRCVAMVGDGINDGPALAEADLGIAMGEGTQLALEAADVALLSGDLLRLPYIFRISGKTLRIIRQNLFWALFYNVVSVPAAAGVYGPKLTIGPLFAAAAMLVSSLSVVFNSLRLQDSGKD